MVSLGMSQSELHLLTFSSFELLILYRQSHDTRGLYLFTSPLPNQTHGHVIYTLVYSKRYTERQWVYHTPRRKVGSSFFNRSLVDDCGTTRGRGLENGRVLTVKMEVGRHNRFPLLRLTVSCLRYLLLLLSYPKWSINRTV